MISVADSVRVPPIVGQERLLHGDCMRLFLTCLDNFKAWILWRMVSDVTPIVSRERLLHGDCSCVVLACVEEPVVGCDRLLHVMHSFLLEVEDDVSMVYCLARGGGDV
jgi:hypothetical protein